MNPESDSSHPTSSPPSTATESVLDTSMRVNTPENISFEYQLAGPFRRILAYLIDLLVVFGSLFAMYFLVSLLFIFVLLPLMASGNLDSLIGMISGMTSGVMLVITFVLFWFYGPLMETIYNGQTLGKRWTGLRVLSVDGHSIDGVQATLRNLFRLLDICPMVPFYRLIETDPPVGLMIPTCLFGLVVMAISKKYQRLGDLVCGTVVIVEARQRRPELVTFADQRVPGLAEILPAHFMPANNIVKALAEYAEQRRYYTKQRAIEIAYHLAEPLREQFGLPHDTDPDLLLCALYHKIFASGAAYNEVSVLPSVHPSHVQNQPPELPVPTQEQS